MNLILQRTQVRKDGIFSELHDENGRLIAVTLEHAFPILDRHDAWSARIPPGEFKCVRGEHYLHGMTTPFETFEVYGVLGHVGILFHWGNFNKDSEGCVLLGDRVRSIGQGPQMILNSKVTFEKFMALQQGLDTFELAVKYLIQP